MNIRILAVGIMALASAASASAAMTSVSIDGYSLSYEDSSILGGMSSSFTSSGNSVGFSWSLPAAVNVVSVGTTESMAFTLPDFTITANPGYNLSGPLAGFLGNLVYTEVGGATTSVSATANVSVNGGAALPVGGNLARVETVSFAGGSSGYYGSSTTVPAGSFNSFSVSNFVLTLNASGGSFASILAQPQNELKISFLAASVPESETYAMMLAGLGLIAAIARRRKHSAQ